MRWENLRADQMAEAVEKCMDIHRSIYEIVESPV